MARGSARGSSVGCARNERPSHSQPLVVVRASDFGRPSRPQAHLPVGGALGSAASPSSHPPSGAGSPVKPSQHNKSTSERVKNPGPSLTTGAPATAPPFSNNESRPSLMDPMAKRQHPARCRCRLMGQRRSLALHAAPNCNGSLPTRGHSGFVREVLNLIYVRPFSSFHL